MVGMSARQLYAFDSLLTSAERAIADSVAEWGRHTVVDHLPEWFDRATVPTRELALGLGELGVLGMHLEGYECPGATAGEYGMACFALERLDSGLRSLVSVQGSLAMFAIHHWGSEEHKQRWLPEMAAGRALGCFGLTEADFGSNPAGMRTWAARRGTDWVLNGTKMWITNGSVADVAIVWANTDEGIRGFVVPTDTRGFGAGEVHQKMSLRASVTSELVLDEVRLPADAMLPKGQGLRGPLTCLDEARFGIVFGALGAAEDCLETARAYAAEREVFGRSLAGFQLTQQKLADMAIELGNGLLLALHLARLKDAGELRPEQVSVGKLNNTRKAIAIARECRTILGANGISLEYPVIRHANNLESVLTYEGTVEVHTLAIGNKLTGTPAFM